MAPAGAERRLREAVDAYLVAHGTHLDQHARALLERLADDFTAANVFVGLELDTAERPFSWWAASRPKTWPERTIDGSGGRRRDRSRDATPRPPQAFRRLIFAQCQTRERFI